MTNHFEERECPDCDALLIPGTYAVYPLHDGDGNYYLGCYCPNPHCNELRHKSRLGHRDDRLMEEIKKFARLDQDPPEYIEDLEDTFAESKLLIGKR